MNPEPWKKKNNIKHWKWIGKFEHWFSWIQDRKLGSCYDVIQRAAFLTEILFWLFFRWNCPATVLGVDNIENFICWYRLQGCSFIQILYCKKKLCWMSLYFHLKDRETGVTKWTSEVHRIHRLLNLLLIKGQFSTFRMSSRRNKKISCLWKIKFTVDNYGGLMMARQRTNAQIHYESLNFHLRWKTQWKKNCDHVL